MTRLARSPAMMRSLALFVLITILIATSPMATAAERRKITEVYADGVALVNDVLGVMELIRHILGGNLGRLLGIRPELQPMYKAGLSPAEILSLAQGLIEEGYYQEGTSLYDIVYNTYQMRDGRWITREQLREQGLDYFNGKAVPYYGISSVNTDTYLFRLKDYPKILIRGETNQFIYTYEILKVNSKGETEVVSIKTGAVSLDWNKLRSYYGCNTNVVLDLPYETPAGNGVYKDPIPMQFIGETRSGLTWGPNGISCSPVTAPTQSSPLTNVTPTVPQSSLPSGFRVVTGENWEKAVENWESSLDTIMYQHQQQQIMERIAYAKQQQANLLIQYEQLLRDAFVRQPDLANQCVGELLEGSYHFSAVVERVLRDFAGKHPVQSCSPDELIAYVETDQMRNIRLVAERLEAEIQALESQIKFGYGI